MPVLHFPIQPGEQAERVDAGRVQGETGVFRAALGAVVARRVDTLAEPVVRELETMVAQGIHQSQAPGIPAVTGFRSDTGVRFPVGGLYPGLALQALGPAGQRGAEAVIQPHGA